MSLFDVDVSARVLTQLNLLPRGYPPPDGEPISLVG